MIPRAQWLRGGALVVPAVVLIVLSVLLGWALLWPESACSEPGCVRQRFTVLVEVDAFSQVPAVAFEMPVDDGRVSLRAILAEGGIDTTILPGQSDLPYQAASGALDRADLYQFAAAWRDRDVPRSVDAKVYALLAPALVSDSGEPLFGIMFDATDREGFAVAPATTAHEFGEREPGSIPLLQLRTFVHELLHSLNRRHVDAVRASDGRLTLEAPTRCIANVWQGQWSLREAPLMAVSPATIRFFQTAAKGDVLPGRDNAPFQLRRSSPTECEDARASSAADPARTRWEFALKRLHRWLSISAASAAQPEEADELVEAVDSPVQLRVQAMPSAYPLGYPVAVRLIARNTADVPLPIKGRLSPSYGIVRIEYRRSNDPDWHVLQPLAWFEPVDDDEAMLLPGEVSEQTVPVYFGEDGWTLSRAGSYEVRARLQAGIGSSDAVSAPVTVTVEDPKSPDDAAALRPLINRDGHLDDAIGRMLAFGGRIGREQSLAPLQRATEDHGHTALGGALRLTLITQGLRPPIDPRTGARPEPDFRDARELLTDTCTDSGVAALKAQLLQRHAGGIPESLSNRAETPATAWDGTSSMRGETLPTYSDPALRPWGPSLHYCFDDAVLRGPPRAAIRDLARQLRRDKPKRMLVVGHSDYQGACRYNDGLALRRAEGVRQALIAAGLRAGVVKVASLGERRPLDFASTRDAHDLNRRVEILLEPGAAAADGVGIGSRVMSSCAARPR